MKTEDIIKRLKNPEQYRNTPGTSPQAQSAPQEVSHPAQPQSTHKTSWLELGVGAAVGVLFVKPGRKFNRRVGPVSRAGSFTDR